MMTDKALLLIDRTKYPSKKLTPCYKCITFPICKGLIISNGVLSLTRKCILMRKYIHVMNRELYLFRLECIKRTFSIYKKRKVNDE